MGFTFSYLKDIIFTLVLLGVNQML